MLNEQSAIVTNAAVTNISSGMCSLRVAWGSPGSKTAPIAVMNYWYQLCGQAKAALQIQRHTCLCRAARITNTVVRRTT